jgi:hypothetical protein
MARFDIEAARDTCLLLRARGGIDGHDWGPIAWGLWTGVSVSYARPFSASTLQLVDSRWQQFDDPDLQAVHDRMILLRDKLFGHNDATPWRKVFVFPPGEARPLTKTTEEQTTLNTGAIEPIERLCAFQISRLEERIGEIGAVLFAGVTHRPFTMLSLDEIPNAGC